MNIADTSVRWSPSTWYTSDSGLFGSRNESSPMFAGLSQCSKPVAESPMEKKPMAPIVETSANCGRSASVLAARVSARACWSAVTPATPEKSIGAAGSHGRGHAVGSAAP